jgi:two-component system osmolarity sensor histidine kinase EnvZ
MRRELLFDLASNEGIRIYPLEKTDRIVPPEDSPIVPELEYYVRQSLDENTAFASSVNDVAGFWVSFNIDDDQYWLMLDREAWTAPPACNGWAGVRLRCSCR